MATATRDAKLVLNVEALGQENISKLEKQLRDLAATGDASAAEFSTLADQIARLGGQNEALQAVKTLAADTDALRATQERAAQSVQGLTLQLDTLKVATTEAKTAQDSARAALIAGEQAYVAAGNAIRALKVEYDSAGRQTTAYRDRLAAAVGVQNEASLALVGLRDANRQATAAVTAANAEQRKAEAVHKSAAAQYTASSAALEKQATALHQAGQSAAALGVDVGDLAAAEAELVTTFVNATAAMRDTDRAIAEAAQKQAELAAGTKRVSDAFAQIDVRPVAAVKDEIAAAKTAMETLATAGKLTGGALANALAQGEAKVRALELEMRQLTGTTTMADKAASLLKSSIGRITAGNVVADGVGYLVNKVKEMGREFLAANLQMAGMRRALDAVYKDAGVTASQIDFLRKTADEAGVSAGGLADSFKSFAVSSKAANIPLETTNALFASVAHAGATLGLSGERVSLVLQALGQMAAKGTVSMEELRQQLGESLPGALALSAKGLGLTEAQLIKLVESGGLATRDLFPALAKALRELQGETEGVTSTWERFKNALSMASQNSGDAGGMQLLTLSVKALGAVVSLVVVPLAAFAEVVFGVAKAIGVLVGALATLTNPMQALGDIANQASARQRALTDSFKSLVFGADEAAKAHVAAGAAVAQAGQDAGAAAVGVAQLGAAHGAAAGAVQAHAAAQQAIAIATRIAADASLDASAKWVQLGVQLRAVADAQDQQVKNSEKLAAAAKIEGDGLQALATLRGNDLESLQAASVAAEANAAALEKVATAREAHLATLRAELDTKKALISGSAEEQKARETELKEIQKKIDALDAEATAGRVAAEASKNDAAARRAAVAAYQDNAAAVGALRVALDQAIVVQEAFESDRRRGLATDQQVAEAKRRAAEAQRLYNDALNDAVAAEQRKAAAQVSAQQLERVGLDLAMAQAKAAETKAIYDGNEYAATQARIKQKEIEIASIKLVAAQLKAEADALDAVSTKKIEALVLEGKWTDALAAEYQLLRQSAEAKRMQATATETELAQRQRELKALKDGTAARDDNSRSLRNEAASRGENQKAMQAQEDAMDRVLMKYTMSAKYSERQIALLEREAAAAEKAAEAYRKKWNIDKDGFTLDANGKRQEMSVPTGSYVFQTAKTAGLSEAEAIALMDQYFQNGHPTGMAGKNGINGPSQDWFSVVNEAISKAVIDKARQNAGKQGTGDAAGGGAAQATPAGVAATAGVKTVNVTINGGRGTSINTASGSDANALVGVLRQLETESMRSS